MRSWVYIGLVLTLFVSCQENEKVVYILFDNSEGLNIGSDVMLNGVSVGKVLEVELTKDNEVLTSVELSKDVDFPKGSAFEIQSKDLFTKIIHITLNDSDIMIESGDTIGGIRSIDLIDQVSCGTNKPPKIIDEVREMLKN